MKNLRSIIPALAFTAAIQETLSFSVNSISKHVVSSTTKLHLEDKIAEMIDLELLRLENKEEYEKAWKAKNQKVIEPVLPTTFNYDDFAELNGSDVIERRRDARMARKSPERYCADRCVSTGHCDVFEDILEMDAMEVMKFCTDCVLSEEEEPCDIPEKMLDDSFLSLKP